MRLRPTPIEVSEINPFEHDLLERKGTADALTELLLATPDGLVIALNAPWGQGKTTFLSMWRQDLENKNFRTLSFSAWETDFAQDPLIALIGELEIGISALRKEGGAPATLMLSESLSKIKAVGAKILGRSIPVAVKIGTAGLLDLDDFSEEALAEFSGKIAEDKITAYSDSKKNIQSFREQIRKIAIEISESTADEEKKPLVLIIDELDRCRPDYAIKVLECIKHLFAVPGVVFVLAVDRLQLGHAIKSQYAQEMDSNGYLRRFFDIELSLPSPDPHKFTNSLFQRFSLDDALIKRKGGAGRYDRENLLRIFPSLFVALDCSLRDRERCFALLSFAIRTTPDNDLLVPDLLAALIVFRVKKPDLYELFINNLADPDALLAAIGAGSGGKLFINSRPGALLEALIFASKCDQHNSSVLQKTYEERSNDVTDPDGRKRALGILQYLMSPGMQECYGCLDYLVSKIDLAAKVSA